MHFQPLFDPTFGLKAQAFAVAALLGTTEHFEGGEGDDEITREMLSEIQIESFPDYNGREKGIIIQVSHWLFTYRVGIVAFGENRASDSTYVATWIMKKPFNQPTHLDMPEEACTFRRYFDYDKITVAAEHVKELIRGYVVLVYREHAENQAKRALTV